MALLKRKPKQAAHAEIVALSVQEAPPTPIEAIDAKIRDVVIEQAELSAELARIENAIADVWENIERRTELARQAAGIQELLQASAKVITRYQHERAQAVKNGLLATFQADVDRYAAQATALLAHEANVSPEIERAHNEDLQYRRTTRGELVHTQIQAPHDLERNAAAQFTGDPAILAEISAAKEAITRAVPEWHTIWKKV